ncbi:hypothetical protein I317_07887 [Kwoniella heveanensis CBS 569]|nr:hypothetical protein I317_07887 [Kwoniella heveanensis CBS 569]
MWLVASTPTLLLTFSALTSTSVLPASAHPLPGLSSLWSRSAPVDANSQASEQVPTIGLYVVSFKNNQCLTPSLGYDTKNGDKLITLDCDDPRVRTWHVPYSAGLFGLSTLGLAMQPDGDGVNGDRMKASSRPVDLQKGWSVLITDPLDGSKTLWLWNTDNRIATSGGTQCLDMGKDGPQMYDCQPENTNQIWIMRNTTQPQRLENLPVMDKGTGNGYIHPRKRDDICVSVASGDEPHSGHGVALTYCSGKGDRSGPKEITTSQTALQWTLPPIDTAGRVKLTGAKAGLCLETGVRVKTRSKTSTSSNVTEGEEKLFSDGMGIRVEICDEKRKGQEWHWNGKMLRVTGGEGDQCLNLLDGAGPVPMSNFINLCPLQTWKCSNIDPNQVRCHIPLNSGQIGN